MNRFPIIFQIINKLKEKKIRKETETKCSRDRESFFLHSPHWIKFSRNRELKETNMNFHRFFKISEKIPRISMPVPQITRLFRLSLLEYPSLLILS